MRRLDFTLIEVLVAAAILGILAALLLTVSNQMTASWNRLSREQTRFSELMVLDRTLDHVLPNAIPFVWRDKEKKSVPAFLGETNRLRLCYRHPLNTLADGALRFLGLRLERDGTLKAYYMERPFFDWDNPEPTWRQSVLARDVKDLRFRYADWTATDKSIRWIENWDPDRPELPLAILVSVTWRDGRQECWLRRTAGNGQYERFGNWRPEQGTWAEGVLAPGTPERFPTP